MLLLLIILTILSWGLAQILIKKGLTYLTPWQSYAADTLIALFIWLPYAFWAGIKLGNLPLISLPVMILLGFNVGLYYYVIDKGPVSIIAPIVAVYPAITLIFANVFLKESLTLPAVMGILTIIGGVIILSWPQKLRKIKLFFIFLALINSLGWGLEGITNKYLIANSSNGTFLVLLALGQIIAVGFWFLVDRPVKIIPKLPGKYTIPTILGVILWNAGTITYAIAMEKEQTSLITPLTNLYIAVTVILSVFYLKEKIRKIQWIGIALIVAGLIVLQLPNQIFHLGGGLDRTPRDIKNSAPSIIPANISKISRAKIVYVFDGDTVQIADGTHIRLIGIDAPEYKANKREFECFGKEASGVLTELVLNREAELIPDHEEKDDYGRTLRYIRVDEVFVNEFLVRQGYAKAIVIKPNTRYSSLLLSAQKEARENKRGLWGACKN